MENCYLLSWKEGKDPLASAFAPEDTKPSYELISDLNGLNELPFELDLIKLDVDINGLIKSNDLSNLIEIWRDYQPNSLAWPLMSERMKSIVEDNLTGDEGIDWISALVNSSQEKRKYYIPRFNTELDVLNFEKTMFIDGTDHILKPVFDSSKLGSYTMFIKPSSFQITPGIYIKETLRKIILKEKLTGISFEMTKVV